MSASLLTIIIMPNFVEAIYVTSPISGQGTWESTLQGRDLNGDGDFDAYYDATLDITWLANVQHGAGSVFDDAGWNGGTTTDGAMTWSNANAWVESLDIYGIVDWRLPKANPINGTILNGSLSYDGTSDRGYNITAPGTEYAGSADNEMAHLFYNTLGNRAYYDVLGNGPQYDYGFTNSGPFSNVPFGFYWSSTEYTPYTDYALYFYFKPGLQSHYDKRNALYVWAVHDGDLDVVTSEVPLPAAVLLFGSGLIGLIAMAKK